MFECNVVSEYIPSIYTFLYFSEGANPKPEWPRVAREVNDILYSLKRSMIIHEELKAKNFIFRNHLPSLTDLDFPVFHRSEKHFAWLFLRDIARFEKTGLISWGAITFWTLSWWSKKGLTSLPNKSWVLLKIFLIECNCTFWDLLPKSPIFLKGYL